MSETWIFSWRLPTIEEDSENSSYNEKEVHGLTLPDISSVSTIFRDRNFDFHHFRSSF